MPHLLKTQTATIAQWELDSDSSLNLVQMIANPSHFKLTIEGPDRVNCEFSQLSIDGLKAAIVALTNMGVLDECELESYLVWIEENWN